EQWLSERRGSAVSVHVPQRGKQRELLQQAAANAQETMRQMRIKLDYDAERTASLLNDLQARLALPALPVRIECYDISNIQGQYPVGSMVVFEDGRPKPAHYRHFRIKTVQGANDYAMLQEVLRRRFSRHARSEDGIPEEPSFHRLAIPFHRVVRKRDAFASVLDGISGLGPVRRRALLRRFGGIENIRNASVEELMTVKGIIRPVAVAIKEIL